MAQMNTVKTANSYDTATREVRERQIIDVSDKPQLNSPVTEIVTIAYPRAAVL